MTNSERLYEEGQRYIPGGVNSPVRAFRAVGGNPLFIQRAQGARIWDVDDNEYIDYVASWGPMILGHRHPAVVEALSRTLRQGTSFGAPTALEIELAERVIEAIRSDVLEAPHQVDYMHREARDVLPELLDKLGERLERAAAGDEAGLRSEIAGLSHNGAARQRR